MLKQRKFRTLAALAGILLISSTAGAGDDFYAHYNRHLYHHLSLPARSAAMGGAYTALRGRQMGLLGNPASLGWQEDYFVMLNGSYSEVSSDISVQDPVTTNTVYPDAEVDIWNIGTGLAVPLEWGGVGINYDYRDDDGDALAVFPGSRAAFDVDLERHQISAGVGYRVMDNLSLGYRYSYMDWDGDQSFSTAGPLPPVGIFSSAQEFEGHRNQVGVQYIIDDNWTLGLDGYYGFGDLDFSNFDFGTGTTTVGDFDADSWAIRGGFAWSVLPELPLLIALDVNYEKRELDVAAGDTEEDLFGVHVGAEYELYKHLFLRAGYQYEDIDFEDNAAGISEDPTVSGYTAGLGYAYERFSLDYAFVLSDTGDNDLAHYVVLGVNF